MLKEIYITHRDFFDRAARQWPTLEREWFNFQKLKPLMNINKGDIVLDVGCGTGNMIQWLTSNFVLSKVIGLDMSYGMLEVAKNNTTNINVTLIQGYAEYLPISHRSIDVIINYCAFPHFKNKKQILSEFERVLKNGGRVYIIHPGGREWVNSKHQEIGPPVDKDLIPSLNELVPIFEECGFDIEKLLDEKELFFIGLRKPLLV